MSQDARRAGKGLAGISLPNRPLTKRVTPHPRVGANVMDDTFSSQHILEHMDEMMNSKFDRMTIHITQQLQSQNSKIDRATIIAMDAQKRSYNMEQEVMELKNNTIPPTPQHIARVMKWREDIQRDLSAFEEISGQVYIKAPNNVPTSPQQIAQTINTNKTIIPRNKPFNSFRIQVGPRGREGTLAVNNFLTQAKPRLPPGYRIMREKTPLSLQREKAVRVINSSIQQTIASQPTYQGLNTHVGTNGSSIFLSYANRNDARDPTKHNCPAYEYPVWQHVPFSNTMYNFTGGFDYTHTENLDPTFILSTIQAILPAENDTHMPTAPQHRHAHNNRSNNSNNNTTSNINDYNTNATI